MKTLPNIVLITTDHMRGDFMGCAGNPIIQTPHIDFLARRGIRFSQAISSMPVCIPARAMIMTGMEGHRMGITSFKEGFEIPVRGTLPRLLGESGYQTQVVGKMHVFPERRHNGFDSMLLCEEGRLFGVHNRENRGYDDYEQWLAEQGYSGQAFAHGMANNEYQMSPWHLPDHLHPTEWIGNETCKAIKRRDWTRPLFIWSSFTAPHPPLTPLIRDLYLYERDEMPKPVHGDWIDRHSLFHQGKLKQYSTLTEKQMDLTYRAFYALITQIDRQVNRIIGTLREQGMLDNTWFIFTADHGDNLGDHGIWAKSNFLKGSCNIPFIITPPPRGDLDKIFDKDWVPGEVSRSVVGLQDILPTCMEIAGIPVPDHCDGKSLYPLVREPNCRARDFILGELSDTFLHGYSTNIEGRSFMLTDGEWKYIWYETDGRELLFHLENDPDELHDLCTDRPELSKIWRERLIGVLANRDNDRALEGHELKPIFSTNQTLPEAQLARTVNDLLPRGLH